MPANPNNPLSHAVISIDEDKRIWEEQPEDEAAVEEQPTDAGAVIAGPAALVDPPMPVDPLMAFMQQWEKTSMGSSRNRSD